MSHQMILKFVFVSRPIRIQMCNDSVRRDRRDADAVERENAFGWASVVPHRIFIPIQDLALAYGSVGRLLKGEF